MGDSILLSVLGQERLPVLMEINACLMDPGAALLD